MPRCVAGELQGRRVGGMVVHEERRDVAAYAPVCEVLMRPEAKVWRRERCNKLGRTAVSRHVGSGLVQQGSTGHYGRRIKSASNSQNLTRSLFLRVCLWLRTDGESLFTEETRTASCALAGFPTRLSSSLRISPRKVACRCWVCVLAFLGWWSISVPSKITAVLRLNAGLRLRTL